MEPGTLSSIDGRYANLYDNIWVSRDSTLPITGVGILRFPEILTEATGRTWTHEKARRHVSDHAPVHVLLDGAQLAMEGSGEWNNSQPQASADEAGRCVDLNEADAEELQRIVHIGPERAEAIIEGRPWESVRELRRVPGIGPGRLQDIQEQGLVCQ